jgi:PAS domain S-box-containing protein
LKSSHVITQSSYLYCPTFKTYENIFRAADVVFDTMVYFDNTKEAFDAWAKAPEHCFLVFEASELKSDTFLENLKKYQTSDKKILVILNDTDIQVLKRIADCELKFIPVDCSKEYANTAFHKAITQNIVTLHEKAALKLLEEYKIAVDSSTILSKGDLDGVITYVNDEFCKISGYSTIELLGRPHSITRHQDTPKHVFEDMWNTIKNGKIWKGTIKNQGKNQDTYIVETTIIPVFSDFGDIEEFIGVRHDITSKQKLSDELAVKNKEIKRLMMTDLATMLPNYDSFVAFLNDGAPKDLSLLAIKIDHLNNIKDVLGHEFADAYVKELSVLLTRFTDGFEKRLGIYRIDSDEFCVVFDGAILNPSKTSNDLLALIRFFYASYKDISITSPATIAVYEGSSANLEHKIAMLLAFAYEKHRGEFIIGNEREACLVDQHPANIFWLSKYSGAIEADKMIPFFQPILNNETNKIEKYECLARILDDDTVISPDKFIDLAMRAKQIPFLTKAIIRRAFEKFKDHPELEFSINLSAMDLQDDFLLRHAIYWQEKTQTDPSRVVFEILETEDIYRYGSLRKSLANIKDIGFKIAIDDFGTGYSNFISLFQYKVDYIKIDGSIIERLDKEPRFMEVVDNLNGLIHMCGAKSIAEFVSSVEIQETVKNIGIDFSQGYFIGEPLNDLIL